MWITWIVCENKLNLYVILVSNYENLTICFILWRFVFMFFICYVRIICFNLCKTLHIVLAVDQMKDTNFCSQHASFTSLVHNILFFKPEILCHFNLCQQKFQQRL